MTDTTIPPRKSPTLNHCQVVYTCNKPNHFARSRACKKKAVSELQAEQSVEYHLFSVRNSSNEAPWRVSVKLNETDRRTSFKIRHGSRCVRHVFAHLQQHVTKASSTEYSRGVAYSRWNARLQGQNRSDSQS